MVAIVRNVIKVVSVGLLDRGRRSFCRCGWSVWFGATPKCPIGICATIPVPAYTAVRSSRRTIFQEMTEEPKKSARWMNRCASFWSVCLLVRYQSPNAFRSVRRSIDNKHFCPSFRKPFPRMESICEIDSIDKTLYQSTDSGISSFKLDSPASTCN